MLLTPEMTQYLMLALLGLAAGAVILKALSKIKMGWVIYAFMILCGLCLAVGNALTELPTAKMFAHDKVGEIAYTLIIFGISGVIVLFGEHAASKKEKLFRDVFIGIYSISASTLGTYATNLNAEQQNVYRAQLIESLQSDIDIAKYGPNGLSPRDGSTPCQETTWCISKDLRQEVRDKTSQLNDLMSAKTTTPFKSFEPLAALLRLPVELIVFVFNTIRSGACMYLLIVVVKMSTIQYAKMNGRLPQTKTDNGQTQPDKRKTSRRQPIMARFKRRRQTKTYSNEELIKKLSGAFGGQDKATMRKVQSELDKRVGYMIDNNRAAKIASALNA